MSRRDDRVSLHQMLDHLDEAVRLAADRTRADLDTDRLFFLALPKLVEIVGEAAARVSNVTREGCREIPWRQIIGTHNRLVHGSRVWPSTGPLLERAMSPSDRVPFVGS